MERKIDREQFTFYKSFFLAIHRVKSKTRRCDLYDAVCTFALTGEDMPLDDSVAGMYELMRPNLAAGRKKAKSGKTGGMAGVNGKRNESKPEANGKQNEGKKEKEDKDKNKNKCSIADDELKNFSEELRRAVQDWLAYKEEKRQPYKPTGRKALLAEIQNKAAVYGEDAVKTLIRESMSANYQGIVWDKLGKKAAAASDAVRAASNAAPSQADMERMQRMLKRYGD